MPFLCLARTQDRVLFRKMYFEFSRLRQLTLFCFWTTRPVRTLWREYRLSKKIPLIWESDELVHFSWHFNKYELDLLYELNTLWRDISGLSSIYKPASFSELHHFTIFGSYITKSFRIVYMHYVMAGLKKRCRVRDAGPN